MTIFLCFVLKNINEGISRVYIYIGALGTHPHLGATRPRVGIAKLGVDATTWQ